MCRLAWLLDHYFSSLTTAALSYDSYVQSQIRDKFHRKVNYDLLATNLIEDESVVDRIQFYPSKVI